MKKQAILIAVSVCFLLCFFAIPVWLSQPPFRLNRKVITKLPYESYQLLVTDLDYNGHPEVLAVNVNKPPFWIRSPLDIPDVIEIAGCEAIGGYEVDEIPMHSVPVLVGNKLRLLRYRNGKANFEPLPFVHDKAFDRFDICQGEGTGTVFLETYLGTNAWIFVLTEDGEWKFVGKFVSDGYIHDLADLDKDGKLDAICIRGHSTGLACVVWGDEKRGETDLGNWTGYGCPSVSDLNNDGWTEIVMVVPFPTEHLQIWSFDQERKKLKVIAKSTLNLVGEDSVCHLFDLDGDSLLEIVLEEVSGDKWLVFKLEGKKLKMWRGKRLGTSSLRFFKDGKRKYFETLERKTLRLFPPLIWFEGRKLQWKWEMAADYSIFWELPDGKDALLPSNWRKHEAPFELVFAADIDGDGSDELIGRDEGKLYRLYWFHRTKSGELEWRSILLRGKKEIVDWALVKDGNRRGLCITWEDRTYKYGIAELLTMRK